MEFEFNLSKKQYGVEFDFRIIKTNYCCNCGSRLKRKIKVMAYLNKSKINKKLDFVYICPQTIYFCKKCNYYISYQDQKKISKKQKQFHSLILSNSKQQIEKVKLNKFLYKSIN